MNETFLKEISSVPSNDPDTKEKIILDTINNLIQINDYQMIYEIVSHIQELWPQITTARITKIIKKTMEKLPKEENSEIINLISNLIHWSNKEGKKLLKLELEVRKISFFLYFKKFKECLENIPRILKELKKFDDKENQIRLLVYESKAYYEISDLAQARSAMTSARALAVSSYCSSDLQAQIDLLSGMFVCDEGNYSIAFSYFLESLDGFFISKNTVGANFAVRYLILSKIISKKYSEVDVLMKNKSIIPFLNDQAILLFLKIKEICKKRDLKEYQEILTSNPILLSEDTFIKKHLTSLYNTLLENNILKIVEPYSNVKIKLIAEKMAFSYEEVEEKLRKMILDGKITGIIDNVNHSLLLFERNKEIQDDQIIENIKNLKKSVSQI